MNTPEGVTWLLQMAREMSIEAQQWRFFAVTWRTMGFAFDEGLFKRLRAHAKALEEYLANAKGDLVPRAANLTPSDISKWAARLARLQRAHGELVHQFRAEAEEFEDTRTPFPGRAGHL